MLRALYVLDPSIWDKIYGPDEQTAIARHVEVLSPALSAQEALRRPDLLGRYAVVNPPEHAVHRSRSPQHLAGNPLTTAVRMAGCALHSARWLRALQGRDLPAGDYLPRGLCRGYVAE